MQIGATISIRCINIYNVDMLIKMIGIPNLYNLSIFLLNHNLTLNYFFKIKSLFNTDRIFVCLSICVYFCAESTR